MASQNLPILLKVTLPDGRTIEKTAQGESVSVGSGEGAAVRVADPSLSALHFMLQVDRNQLVTVIDLGSKKGTRLGGKAIEDSTALASGDVLEAGACKFKVTWNDGETTDRVNGSQGSKTDPELPAPQASKGGRRSPPPPREVSGATGPAAKLFNEELPAEETPGEDNKQLEVAMLWGDTLINVRTFGEAEPVTIGAAPSNDFLVFDTSVGESFTLVSQSGKECQVAAPQGCGVVLRQKSAQKDRSQLASEGLLSRSGPAEQLGLGLHDRCQVSVGKVSFIVRYIRPSRVIPTGVLESLDFYFSKVLSVSFMAHLVILAAMFMTDVNPESLSEDLFKNPNRYTKLIIKPPEKNKKKLDLSGVKEGAKAKDKEGKFGKKEAKKEDADTSKKGSPRVDVNKREEDRKKVLTAGLLGALGGAEGASSNVFGPGGLGTGLNSALGGLKGGAGMGDAHGVGGLGSRGTGPGGGGTGLGLGGLGTKGSGRGAGGYGTLDLGGRGKGTTRIVPGKTTVVGALSKEEIGKVIRRHWNEIKYCYEVELNKDPNLYGKIGVQFSIDGAGSVSDANISETTMNNNNVEQCMLSRIRRWKFPEPKGGGTVLVTYPWVFKPAGSGDDDAGE